MPELAPCVCPFEFTTATFAKFVFCPNAELNASACAPVPDCAWFAAFVALVHVEREDCDALHLSLSCSQMKLAMVPMSSADPWLNESGIVRII